jgi:hypothetical protein
VTTRVGSSIVSLGSPSGFCDSGQLSATFRSQQNHQNATIPVIAVWTQKSVCRTNKTGLKFDASEEHIFEWARSRHGGKAAVNTASRGRSKQVSSRGYVQAVSHQLNGSCRRKPRELSDWEPFARASHHLHWVSASRDTHQHQRHQATVMHILHGRVQVFTGRLEDWSWHSLTGGVSR